MSIHIANGSKRMRNCEELDFLNDVAKECGVTGSRIMGGGFGGCTINLVKDELYDQFIADTKAKYTVVIWKEDLDGVVGLMNDWISYIEGYCTIDRNFCLAVRQEGKSLIGALGAILSESFSVMKPVDERIIEAAGVSSGCKGVKFGIPAESRVREIVRDYYLGGGADDK